MSRRLASRQPFAAAAGLLVACVACAAAARLPQQLHVVARQDPGASSTLLNYSFASDQSGPLGIVVPVQDTRNAAASEDWKAARAAYDGSSPNNAPSGLTLKTLGANKPAPGTSLPDEVSKYAAYWKTGTDFPNLFMDQAFAKAETFSSASDQLRAGVISTGLVTLNIWTAIVMAMSEGAQLCGAKGGSGGGAVAAWDRAFALYAGQGADQEGGGKLLWAINQEALCVHFGTCPEIPNTGMNLNADVRDALLSGQAAIKAGKCDEAKATVNKVLSHLRVPLAQGIMYNAYKVDPSTAPTASESDRGTAWAYAAGLLPAIDKCSGDAAKTVRENLDPSGDKAVKDGFEAVSRAIFSVHGCLDITCAQIGGLLNAATYLVQPCTDDGTASNQTGYNATGTGVPPSGEKSSSTSNAGKIVGGIVAVAVLIAILIGLYCIFCRRPKNIDAPLMPPIDEVDNTFRR